jgi:glyoxylase-like metal-dependent hydrolase (beta-lactamase superfamily II)
MSHTIVQVTDRSTNYWVVGGTLGRLLVDLGWPGRVGALVAALDRKGIRVADVPYGVATHYHMDHAGAAQDLKALGMRLVVLDVQDPHVDRMAGDMKPEDRYTRITRHDNVALTCDASRAWLARTLGIAGELVHTPGHSDDSVSLVLDDGAVFTGDLTWPGFAREEELATVEASWARLRALGARTVHAGHGPVRPMP